MDEITERPAARPLPAPVRPRFSTGPVQLIVPATAVPPTDDVAPVVPYLPVAGPKAASPVTGPVTTTLLATSILNLPASRTNTAAAPKRRHRFLIVLGVLVITALLLGVIFRNTAFVDRFTGQGYDTNPLPIVAVEQPKFIAAVYTLTTQSIAVSEGLPTNFWRTEKDEVDYTTQLAKLTIDRATASVIGGTIGTPRSTSPALELMVDQSSTFLAGDAQTDPWTRQPHEPGWGVLAVLSPHEVMMYQDVVDPALRSQQPTSVITERVHDIPVTTYKYQFPFGKFYESAPRLFEMVRMMDGNAGSDATVVVTVSFDEQWMVRYLDVNVDVQAVLKYKAEADAETPYPYRYTVDVVSTSDAPAAISLPTNVVDATTTTSTTTPLAPTAVTP